MSQLYEELQIFEIPPKISTIVLNQIVVFFKKNFFGLYTLTSQIEC
jgi:hypothetical protein